MQKEIQGVSKKVTVSAEEKQEENRESTVPPVRSATATGAHAAPRRPGGGAGSPSLPAKPPGHIRQGPLKTFIDSGSPSPLLEIGLKEAVKIANKNLTCCRQRRASKSYLQQKKIKLKTNGYIRNHRLFFSH